MKPLGYPKKQHFLKYLLQSALRGE